MFHEIENNVENLKRELQYIKKNWVDIKEIKNTEQQLGTQYMAIKANLSQLKRGLMSSRHSENI